MYRLLAKERLFKIVLVLIVMLYSCGGKEVRLSPLRADDVILAFGDSLTFGTGADPGRSYPETLEKLLNRKVVNSGVVGEISQQGLQRLPQVLREVRPRLVILCHGGNDILRKSDLRETSANIREMIKLIRKSGAEVVLVGVPRPRIVLAVAEFYAVVAKDMDIPYEGDILLTVLTSRDLKSDYIHPNSEGYARMAEAFAAVLKKYGAVK